MLHNGGEYDRLQERLHHPNSVFLVLLRRCLALRTSENSSYAKFVNKDRTSENSAFHEGCEYKGLLEVRKCSGDYVGAASSGEPGLEMTSS
jgi:hypothetical protein